MTDEYISGGEGREGAGGSAGLNGWIADATHASIAIPIRALNYSRASATGARFLKGSYRGHSFRSGRLSARKYTLLCPIRSRGMPIRARYRCARSACTTKKKEEEGGKRKKREARKRNPRERERERERECKSISSAFVDRNVSVHACRKSSNHAETVIISEAKDQRGHVQTDPLISIRNHENSATIGKYIITLDRAAKHSPRRDREGERERGRKDEDTGSSRWDRGINWRVSILWIEAATTA